MKPIVSLVFAAIAVSYGSVAVAEDCYLGYDSRKCLKTEKTLQAQLAKVNALAERAVLQTLQDYDEEYKKDVVQSMRATNAALQVYKDADCYSSPLQDGMSFKDAGVISDQCRVDWRKARIDELKKHVQEAK